MKVTPTILLLFLCFQTGFSKNSIHPEPPHWWIGMENSKLDIMIELDTDQYPKTIMEPYSGVELDSVTKTPSHIFIHLNISSSASPGELQFKSSGNSAPIRWRYTLKERDADSRGRKGFSSADVMYLITPDRFANGNKDNDDHQEMLEKSDRSKPGGRHGGDLRGIIDHLDYIHDMGFTAIWINPILENNMERYSYHGYSTTDLYRIDPRYGSLEEYKELVSKADAMGIKVIQDMIENHIGSNHPWASRPPRSGWINHDGEYHQTSHNHEVVQDPYASEADKRAFNDGWFVRSMPDLNQRDPLLATYLIQNSIWWIEETGLSGIRQDTYPYADKEFMSDWAASILEEYPHFNIVGEEWNYEVSRVAYWQKGQTNTDGYQSHLPSLMDFPLQKAIGEAFHKDAEREDLMNLYRCLAQDFLYPSPGELVTFADNHDMDRFSTRIAHDSAGWRAAMAFLLTCRGVPQIFYGTEILMSNDGDSRHGLVRSDMPGGWPDDTVNAFTGGGLSDEQRDAQLFLKELLNWRKSESLVHTGQMMHFVPEKDKAIYTLMRYDDERVIMLSLSAENETHQLDLTRFKEIIPDQSTLKDILAHDEEFIHQGPIEIPARGFRLLEFKR